MQARSHAKQANTIKEVNKTAYYRTYKHINSCENGLFDFIHINKKDFKLTKYNKDKKEIYFKKIKNITFFCVPNTNNGLVAFCKYILLSCVGSYDSRQFILLSVNRNAFLVNIVQYFLINLSVIQN